MKRIYPGMIIKTSYSERVFRVKEVIRGCTCPSYFDELEYDDPPPRPEHIHIVCTDIDNPRKVYMLNDWIEETLTSLEKSNCGQTWPLDYDRLIILPNDKPVQGELF